MELGIKTQMQEANTKFSFWKRVPATPRMKITVPITPSKQPTPKSRPRFSFGGKQDRSLKSFEELLEGER